MAFSPSVIARSGNRVLCVYTPLLTPRTHTLSGGDEWCPVAGTTGRNIMAPKPSDVLDQARSLIEERLKELDEERQKLESTLSDLGGRVRRGPGRPRGSTARR